MRTMRKIIKLLALLLVILLEVAIVYLGCVFILPEKKFAGEEMSSDVTIYLKHNGIHTDFVFPYKNSQKDWSNDFSWNDTDSKDSTINFVQIGWGDRSFFLETPTWDKLTASTVATAVLGMNDSAIHTKLLKDVKPDDRCVQILISQKQYDRLIQYVEASISRNEADLPVPIKHESIKVYGNQDAFYEANGHLSLFKTCNTWINKGLSTAYLPCVLWTVRHEPIFDLYQS